MKAKQWLSGCGLACVIVLGASAVRIPKNAEARSVAPVHQPAFSSIRLLAVGDVNLGRGVGQAILNGDTLFPFVAVRDSFIHYDIVFANLESQLSDQGGETQHPKNNLIFTGPPAGAIALRKGGVSVVSVANNHALDYGVKALRETIRYLDSAGVLHAGTSDDTLGMYEPAILSLNDIRVAVFACTDVMNFEGTWWKKHVASADTSGLLPRIRALRDSVDFIIVSYHGGDEYADRATLRTREFAREVIAGGADLFIGHHPHVPYGVEEDNGKYIVPSLGNFVFRQPDHFWTQRSFAFAAEIVKDTLGTRVSSFRCLPVRTGFQPEFLADSSESDIILERIRTLSTHTLAQQLLP